MSQTDELFKSKLADHRVAPSANAWAKVEAGLAKKNNTWVWRLAAAFLLLGLLGGTFYLRNSPEAEHQLAETPVTVPQKQATVTEQATEKNYAPAETEQPVIPAVQKKQTVPQHKPVTVTPQVKPQVAAIPEMAQPDVTLMEQIPAFAETHTTASAQTRKPIVIEFTLDALPVKAAEPVVADADTEEKSGFKKILEKARDIKNGDSELGSLRDAKNELFAFDFRKDKTKRN